MAVIATVSRLIAKKQPLFVLEAFRRARERIRCVLLVVGSGPLEQRLRDQVRLQRIPDVVFAGFLNRSEVARAYAAADVFTLLSAEKETFGLVVNEALNFGLPAVVSDRVGCAPDLVSTGANGYVVSSRDPDEAARAFERLAGDAGLRARIGAASRERIDGWDVERSAVGILRAAAVAAPERVCVGSRGADASVPTRRRKLDGSPQTPAPTAHRRLPGRVRRVGPPRVLATGGAVHAGAGRRPRRPATAAEHR